MRLGDPTHGIPFPLSYLMPSLYLCHPQMDLAAEEAVQRARADVLAINSSAEIVCTSHCTVDLALILNRNNYNGLGPPASVAVEPLDTIDEAAEEAGQEEEEAGVAEGGKGGGGGGGGGAVGSPLDRPSDGTGSGKDSLSHHQRSMRRSRSKSRSRAKSAKGSRANYINADHSSHSDHSSHGDHDTTIQTTTLRSSKPLDLEK